MRIVFMGSADFGLPTLKYLLDNENVVSIVTNPPRKSGRGLKLKNTPVYDFAIQNGFNSDNIILQDDLKDIFFIENLRSLNADLFIVIAFRILPPEVFNLPKFGTINLHASLLPKYRGAAPIQRAIEAGEKVTGVTVFKIDEGIDTGNIIVQKSIEIGEDYTTPIVYQKLSQLGVEAIKETIEKMENGNIKFYQQKGVPTSAPKLKKEEGKIIWSNSCYEIFNKIRAFKPYPGTYTYIDNKKLNIEWGKCIGKSVNEEPGTIVEIGKDYFDVACKNGVLRVTVVKPEGKKEMSVKDYFNGKKILKGSVCQ